MTRTMAGLHASRKSRDRTRLCSALNAAGARYLLIGGVAVLARGGSRTTKTSTCSSTPPQATSAVKQALRILEIGPSTRWLTTMCGDTWLVPEPAGTSVQRGETVACAIVHPCRKKAPRCLAATWLRRAWPIGGAVSSRSKRWSSQSVRRGLRNSVSVPEPIPAAERCLYELLHTEDPDAAHGR